MIRKSYAKVNIFLKIAGTRGNYHELVSRFVRVHSLYDIITFETKECDSFTLEGTFGCELKSNTIFKAYKKLAELSPKVEEFFKNHYVKVEKHIPEFAGLGGGSSNCATFMIMVSEYCNLDLSKTQLSQIGQEIGADVPFFIYEYDSANVTGIGEIVEKFDEKILDIEIITPDIKCNTGAIFKSFRDKFYKELNKAQKERLLSLSSEEILREISTEEANDLYEPALYNYKSLNKYNKKDWFFSGSGSSFFRLKNGVENG